MANPNPQFDYQGALSAGYSDEEILPFLTEKHPKFDFKAAQSSGYSPQEINEFLSSYKPEKSVVEQAGRVGAQFGLGLLQGSPSGLAYEAGVAPLASKEAQTVEYRKNLFEDIETFQQAKELGGFPGRDEPWNEGDEAQLQNLIDQAKTSSKSEPFIQTADLSIRGLAEKATGLDLHPEGLLEKGANWLGFIKNPKSYERIGDIGLKPKELIKAISPTGTEVMRGLTAGTALEMAEQGNFGPVGTLAAAITGDLIGFGPGGLLKAAKQPKKTMAQVTNLFTGGNSKNTWVKELVADAREAGIQLDAGTLKNSNIIRFLQSRAAQSAFSGEDLDKFRKNLSQQVINQYAKITDELGTLSFENSHQAAEAIRDFVTKEEDKFYRQRQLIPGEQGEARSLAGRIAVEERPDYQQELLNRIAPEEFRSSYDAGETLKTVAEDIKTPIKEEFNQRWENLNREVEAIPAGPQVELARVVENFIQEQQGSLLLGESTAENRVLQAATRLRNGLMTEEGGLIGVSLRDLMKTKRTLGDIANWEFGGSNFQSAYKQLVGELDRAIERSLGALNPELRSAYEQLNAEYSMFKDVFENKNVLPLFEPKNQNYNTIYSGFLKSPDKIRSLEDMMFDSPRGQQIINQVKRDYAQRIVDDPNLSARDLRNLENVLGPQYGDAIREFIRGRQNALEHPLPRAARQPVLGARVELPEATTSTRDLKGRLPAPGHVQRKMLETIKGKSSDQIMKMMDTVEGIRKLKRQLSLIPGGDELFNKLARYKLFEMIDKNMLDNLQENIKLGTFSGLLKSSKSEAIVKELVGEEAFKRLRTLQKISGKLQESVQKFYNASKSGTTIADAATAGSFVIGLLTGNFYTAMLAALPIGGLKLAGYLLSNAEFLKYFEEAVLTSNKEKFKQLLQSMKPSVDRAIVKASLEARE